MIMMEEANSFNKVNPTGCLLPNESASHVIWAIIFSINASMLLICINKFFGTNITTNIS